MIIRSGKSYRTAYMSWRARFSKSSAPLFMLPAYLTRLPYKLGVNEFADMTWNEFQKHRLGAAQNCFATLKGKLKRSRIKNSYPCQESRHCSGGSPSQAFEYIKYNGGLDTKKAYPYIGENGVCNYSSENVGVRVFKSVNITLGAEDELKYAVGLIKPVSVAFEVVDGFKLYESGVYTSNSCGSDPMDVNHVVLAVGYGVENGTLYWLIKNSWGEDLGDHGYFKMEMGKNTCGVATCASFPSVA
nr:thiol protease aleurain-like [Ipomoea batatas]